MTKEIIQEHSAMAVVFCSGRILATKEDIYGKIVLSLPKGHIEAGETVLEAAIRECFEETNVVLIADNKIAELTAFKISFITPKGQNVEKIITPVLFKLNVEGNPKPLEARIKSVEYMCVDDFLANCAYDNVKQVVQSAITILN